MSVWTPLCGWESVCAVESTGTAQAVGSGLAGLSRWCEAGTLRRIRGTGIVRCSASVGIDGGDAGLMLQTVDRAFGGSRYVPSWRMRMDNYTDLMGKERCWRVN